jgi:hypothetical protein
LKSAQHHQQDAVIVKVAGKAVGQVMLLLLVFLRKLNKNNNGSIFKKHTQPIKLLFYVMKEIRKGI